jgi:hypothetical protein
LSRAMRNLSSANPNGKDFEKLLAGYPFRGSRSSQPIAQLSGLPGIRSGGRPPPSLRANDEN